MGREAQLSVTTTLRSADVCVVDVRGEVDSATADVLQRHLEEVLSESDCNLMLDVANVDFLDSTGLAVLITVHSMLGRRSGQLVLRRPSANVMRALRLTGLDRSLVIQS
jgi:anti-sigma B factor antagonist